MEKELKILMVEDIPADAELELRELKKAGIACIARRVETEPEFRSELEAFVPDVILSDFSLPSFDGLSALRIARELRPETPFLFVSGTIGEERAIEALKNGATDYVLKTNLKRFAPAVRRAIQEAGERAARKRAEQEIADQRTFFRTVIDLDRNFIFAKDREGRFTLVNQALAEAYGTSVEAIEGKTDADFNPNKEEVEHFRRDDVAVMDAMREKFIPQERITDASGRVRWLQTVKRPIMSPDGKANMVLGVATDITERKIQEEKIARLSRIYAVLSGINSAIVRMKDRQELFNEACRIAVEQGGFRMAWIGLAERDAMRARPVAWMGHEEGYLDEVGASLGNVIEDLGCGGMALRERRPVVANDIEADPQVVYKQPALARGYRSLAVLPLIVEGDAAGIFALYGAEKNLFDQDEIKLLAELAGDISFALEYIEKEEKVNYLAFYDALTGLPNRTLFYDRLSQSLHAAKNGNGTVGVVLIDLERFNNINDTLGRQAGDALLKQIAERLKSALQDPNAVARVGGDYFAILAAEFKEASDMAHYVEDTVFRALSQPFHAEGQELRISAKVGIALFPNDGDNADSLYNNAEAALKKAKSSLDRYVFYAPQMNARIAERLTLENRLRNAVEQEQFVLYYQPKVELASGRIAGLEALIRWNDPATGLVPPYKFIPLLEETGMILEVGRWVLEQAHYQHRQWLAKGLVTPRIAVNVSAVQIRQKNFALDVERVIGMNGAHGLDVEITESLIMEDIEGNIEKLKALKERGVKVAIDDFGTGYSSLSYIAKLPVDTLKIDRAFIMNLTENPDDLSIVSVIIALAHSLNLQVVAEGVETEEQQKLLRLLKCDEIQGYLYSPPVPPDKIEPMLAGQA